MQGIYGGIFDGDAKKERIEALEAQMSEGSFWDDQSAAQTVITEVNRLKNVVNPSSAFRKEMGDLRAMLELVDEIGEDPEGEAYQQEIIDTLRF